jgi:hypothetical protein
VAYRKESILQANAGTNGTTGLPPPDSDEFHDRVKNRVSRALYGLLYAATEPLTIYEMKDMLTSDMSTQTHLDRRLRTLDDAFVIERVTKDGTVGYRLHKMKDKPAERNVHPRDRALVLSMASGRCQMCGKTVKDDGIRLHVDHRIPLRWGGSNELENLWAICSEDNADKKAFFSSVESEHDAHIETAIKAEDVWHRMGELMRAFGLGGEIPSELLAMVANYGGDYHDDWQRRLRELRERGFDYDFKKRKDGDRWRTTYIVKKVGPTPPYPWPGRI